MILLDENIPEDERLALSRWKPFQIGYDYWEKGTSDEHIVVRLRNLRLATFISHDRDFYNNRWQYGHVSCAIVFVDAPDNRLAFLVDRFLRHASFRTHSSRMGRVFKLNEQTITIWRVADRLQSELPW